VKNVVKILVVTLGGVALDCIDLAQMKSNPSANAAGAATEKKSEQAQATVLTGKVTAVEPKAGKLTIKTKDKEVKLTTDSKATKSALEKLKVGDTAKIFEKGGKVIAASPVKAESKTKTPK
jgi:hypothetical protein